MMDEFFYTLAIMSRSQFLLGKHVLKLIIVIVGEAFIVGLLYPNAILFSLADFPPAFRIHIAEEFLLRLGQVYLHAVIHHRRKTGPHSVFGARIAIRNFHV